MIPPVETLNQAPPLSLHDAALYLNRELTWLEFNRRVLAQAQDASNPLLERLKFIAIFASNIDEFFMKRIGGLKIQIAANVTERTVDGRSPLELLADCKARVIELTTVAQHALDRILSALNDHDIKIMRYADLNAAECAELRLHYIENAFPLVTPQIFDPAHPFPFISNLSLNILVTLADSSDANKAAIARIKVPVGYGVPRFVRLGERDHFVPLEDIIAHNLDLLFPDEDAQDSAGFDSAGFDSAGFDYDYFFVARNAVLKRQASTSADLLAMIESELQDRRIAPIVRLVVHAGIPQQRKSILSDLLRLDMQMDAYETCSLMAQRDLFELANLPIANLQYPPAPAVNHHLLQPPRRQDNQRSIFYLLREAKSILLQHPFESFATSVVRFLEEAAHDDQVRAIKMTLYRTDKATRIIDLLVQAAQNGKQVAVVVEIKAKFDEAANIKWAERMEEIGIHVTYGVIGLKTHCKVLMVIRQDSHRLRRYVHIGTGNYHGGTAKQYTDLGLLTCDEDIGQDVTELFNYLTSGRGAKRVYKKLLVAPIGLKKAMIARIKREISQVENGNRGLIQMKTNALEDEDIVRALYRASMAGVKVELIVRDTCLLRPAVAGLSDHISVLSIVGRYLEHSRIFYFYNGGKEEYFIGSADLMKRNMRSRVEVVVPISQKSLQDELRLILNTLLDDEVDGWDMQPDGSYQPRLRQEIDGADINGHADGHAVHGHASGKAKAIGGQSKLVEFAQTRLKTKRHKQLLKSGAIRQRN